LAAPVEKDSRWEPVRFDGRIHNAIPNFTQFLLSDTTNILLGSGKISV
jgi:hypothetical protein